MPRAYPKFVDGKRREGGKFRLRAISLFRSHMRTSNRTIVSGRISDRDDRKSERAASRTMAKQFRNKLRPEVSGVWVCQRTPVVIALAESAREREVREHDEVTKHIPTGI